MIAIPFALFATACLIAFVVVLDGYVRKQPTNWIALAVTLVCVGLVWRWL